MIIGYTCDIIKYHSDKYLIFVFLGKFQSLCYPTQLHIIICTRHNGRKGLTKELFSILTIKSFRYEMISSINFFQEHGIMLIPAAFAISLYTISISVVGESSAFFKFDDILLKIFRQIHLAGTKLFRFEIIGNHCLRAHATGRSSKIYQLFHREAILR